jgi:hypothetical protein
MKKMNLITLRYPKKSEKGKHVRIKLPLWWEKATIDEYYLACGYLSKADWDAIK